MVMGSLTIRRATVDDAAAISRVHYAALTRYHDFYAAFFVNHPRIILPTATVQALENPDIWFLVAIETVGAIAEIVGFIRWTIVPEKTTDGSIQSDDKAAQQTSINALFSPKEHMAEILRAFSAREDEMDAFYEQTVDGKRHMYIKNLMVHPDHQRKGIGAQLLRAAVAVSDVEGIPTLLVSSAEAFALYEKLGFRELGTWSIDNEAWARMIAVHERELGISGNEKLEEQYRGVTEVERYMIREPAS